MPAPARFDDTLVAGDSYSLSTTLQDVEVLGGSATLHIRARPEQPPVIVCNGVVAPNGLIVYHIPPAATRKLDGAREGHQQFIYHAQFTSSTGDVTTYLGGYLRVLKDIAV